MVRVSRAKSTPAAAQIEPLVGATLVSAEYEESDYTEKVELMGEEGNQQGESEAEVGNENETDSAEANHASGYAVAIPESSEQSTMSLVADEPEPETQTVQPQFNDPVEGMHYANHQLAELLLQLPLHKVERVLRSSMGLEAVTRWVAQVEAAKAGRVRWEKEIIRQSVMGSLGCRT